MFADVPPLSLISGKCVNGRCKRHDVTDAFDQKDDERENLVQKRKRFQLSSFEKYVTTCGPFFFLFSFFLALFAMQRSWLRSFPKKKKKRTAQLQKITLCYLKVNQKVQTFLFWNFPKKKRCFSKWASGAHSSLQQDEFNCLWLSTLVWR